MAENLWVIWISNSSFDKKLKFFIDNMKCNKGDCKRFQKGSLIGKLINNFWFLLLHIFLFTVSIERVGSLYKNSFVGFLFITIGRWQCTFTFPAMQVWKRARKWPWLLLWSKVCFASLSQGKTNASLCSYIQHDGHAWRSSCSCPTGHIHCEVVLLIHTACFVIYHGQKNLWCWISNYFWRRK